LCFEPAAVKDAGMELKRKRKNCGFKMPRELLKAEN